MKWLIDNWMKATPFLAFYSFILVFLYVKDENYPLYLIWLQIVAYWLHEFEEYVFPGGFLEYINKKVIKSDRADYPMTQEFSFWVNIPIIFLAMPFSAILAHFFGIKFGLWIAYFSFFNALGHILSFVAAGGKYNPGVVASAFINIPVGIYMIWYFLSHNLVSTQVNVISIVISIILQSILVICGLRLKLKNR